MDEIDFSISMMLMVNSRIPYRELAETFNMSVNSIHKRIKSMVKLDVIKNFQTRLSWVHFPNMINVMMFGNSKARNKKILIEKLGKNELVYNVTQASGNLFYIHSFLKKINELDSLVSFVRKEGQIEKLTIGLDKDSYSGNLDDINPISLSKLDYFIIDSLKNNSRKTISDIADETRASTKTIRRHLNLLTEKNLVHFTIDWYPDKTAESLSLIILHSNPSATPNESEIMNELRKKYGSKILFNWTFSNLPDLMIICVWYKSLKELHEMEETLISENFKSVNVTLLVDGRNFKTWINKFLDDKIKELKENST